MPKRKRHSLRHLPPCPNPELYVLVRTKEGNFWRRKRGTVTRAVLNPAMAANSHANKVLMPAASRILRRLEPFTRNLDMGRITVRIAGKLMRDYKEKGVINFAALKDMDLQPDWPLHRLLLTDYSVEEKNEELVIAIEMDKHTVQPQNKLVTDFYFESILLFGDVLQDGGLRINTDESPLFCFGKKQGTLCKLKVDKPPAGKPWLLFLKVNCLEGKEMAAHAKNYAMKVVRVG